MHICFKVTEGVVNTFKCKFSKFRDNKYLAIKAHDMHSQSLRRAELKPCILPSNKSL